MEKVRPWCGQPSDRGRLSNRTEVRVTSELYQSVPAGSCIPREKVVCDASGLLPLCILFACLLACEFVTQLRRRRRRSRELAAWRPAVFKLSLSSLAACRSLSRLLMHGHRQQYHSVAQKTVPLIHSDSYVLWSPYVIGQTIIFLPCDFFLLSSSFFLA